jgi:hypothetical protein
MSNGYFQFQSLAQPCSKILLHWSHYQPTLRPETEAITPSPVDQARSSERATSSRVGELIGSESFPRVVSFHCFFGGFAFA